MSVPGRLNRADIVHLQRAAGNRAVNGLLARRPVQRAIENETYREGFGEADKKKAQEFFHAYDAAADNAYRFVLSAPGLGARADASAQARLWVRLWQRYLSGDRPKSSLMAAAFGYVIEWLVSEDADFKPASVPEGCSVYLQRTYGGTRPDLVLASQESGKDIAWLDLTASNSTGHIFAKEGWAQKVSCFAEVTYPSLDNAVIAMMVTNKDNTGTLSAAELEKRKAAETALYQERKAQWQSIGQEYSMTALKPSLVKEYGRLRLETDEGQLKRKFISDRLSEGFGGGSIEEAMVPSILAAMNVTSTSWGFNAGYSANERAGEKWLVDNKHRSGKTATTKHSARFKPY